MAKFFIIFSLFIVGTIVIGIRGDDLHDILSSSMGTSLDDLELLYGIGNPYRQSRSPNPFSNYRRGHGFIGGKPKIRDLPDLVNFVVGLPGHIIERAIWVVDDAFESLVDGFMSSKFKLKSPNAGGIFGSRPRPIPTSDDLFDDLDLGLGLGNINDNVFGGIGGIAAPTEPLNYRGGQDPLGIMFW